MRKSASAPSISTLPVVNGATPNNARASSVRPEPANPATPTISPARSSRSMSVRSALLPPTTRRRVAPTSPGAAPIGVVAGELPPDHHRHDLPAIRRRGVDGADKRAVLEDRDPLAELEHLGEAMRDIENGDAIVLQPPDAREQLLGFVAGQRCGGFVEDDDTRVCHQCSGDLDHLAIGDGQIARHRPWADLRRHSSRPQRITGALFHR